jgi:hypothetical protein
MTVEDKKKQVLERSANVILEIQATVEQTMKLSLTPKNFAKIGTVFARVGSTTFVQNAYLLEKNKLAIGGLHEAMQQYLLET